MHKLLEEHERVAAEILPSDTYAYYATGSGDEIALREATAAWQRYRLRPHVLRDVSAVDAGVTLLGTRLATPLLVAPTAFHGGAHPEGEIATARGAGAAGALVVVSSRASRPIEDIAAAATGPWWFQVYVVNEQRLSREFAARAVASGAGALVLTVDAPVVSTKRRAFTLPATDAEYVVNLGRYASPDAGPDANEYALDQFAGCTLDTIGEYAGLGVPVLVKGVVRADDALECLDAGASGIVVSNHGGRQLDQSVDTAWALAEVARAVDGRAPVLVDGGIRTGRAVLTALALGADAVLLGRPVLWALAAGGSAGVTAALRALHDEFVETLMLAGLTRADEVPADLVAPAGQPVTSSPSSPSSPLGSSSP